MQDPKEIVSEFIEASKEIERLEAEKAARRTGKESEVKDSKNKIRDEIYALQNKIHDLEIAEASFLRELQEEYNVKFSIPGDKEKETKEIINLLRLKEKGEWAGDVNVEHYERKQERFLEQQDYFYCSRYLKLRFVIAENDKPVNKYSLILFGNGFFSEFIKYPNGYGFNLRDDNTNIRIDQGSFKTVEEARAKMEKLAKNGFFQEKIDKTRELGERYEEIIDAYSLADFQRITYWECYACRKGFKERLEDHENQWKEKCRCGGFSFKIGIMPEEEPNENLNI